VRITRRHLQISLAALWLLDGALQCQPIMFSQEFARKILVPAGHGQPSALATPLHAIAALVSAHPALANGSFAIIQIALGLGILVRRFTRVALTASIVWALLVWIVGEGIGGLAAGATMLTGAPGAALLYAVIATLAWPTRDRQRDYRPSPLALPVWCTLWLTGAGLQLVAGNDTATSFTMMLRAAQSSSPGWIAAIDRHLARFRLPGWAAAGVIALYVLVAIWALVPGWTRQLSVGIGVFIALVGWLLFQGLGDLTSGHATDPNSGPLIALLALAVIGAAHPRDFVQHPRESTARYEPLVRSGHREVQSMENVVRAELKPESPSEGSGLIHFWASGDNREQLGKVKVVGSLKGMSTTFSIYTSVHSSPGP